MTELDGPTTGPAFRKPTISDGAPLWRLVREIDVLDDNSCYVYLLLCRDFADTCLVAEFQGALVGFVTGYVPPTRPDSIFVWQVGVAPQARRRGIAQQLLLQLVASEAGRRAQYLEATVSPSNAASRRLFQAAADALGAPLNVHRGFDRDHFAGQDHEEEELIRIGPLRKAG
ncbi:MAG: diaminobutyrate acetyltransferase [Planctomycetes bacterium]|nr:diaminobutyrate acetyltransferase [Planctomycetota bacterium]